MVPVNLAQSAVLAKFSDRIRSLLMRWCCATSIEPAGPPLTAKQLAEKKEVAARETRAAERAAAAEKAAEEKAAAEKAAEEKAAEERLAWQPWIAESVRTGKSPPLTAEQLTEKKKGAEVIAAQLTKPSYWDEVGRGKPNASALKRALADTVLVDAAWLAQLADAGGVLPRCQDLPEGARVTLEEMEMWKDDYTVGVLVISYPW